MSFTIKVDTSRIDAIINSAEQDLMDAARPAAQAMAQVLYDRVKLNVASMGRVTGKLSDSIYQAFSKDNSSYGRAVYHISWNVKKAPHGHLLEYGHLQRYRVYVGDDGKFHTMVRPHMRGTKKPGRRAPQAVKDAYYVTLPTPIQVPAKAFVRRAMDSSGRALDAGEKVLLERINKGSL